MQIDSSKGIQQNLQNQRIIRFKYKNQDSLLTRHEGFECRIIVIDRDLGNSTWIFLHFV